nr:hypothetical protein [Tanacetum cinerariifolium]
GDRAVVAAIGGGGWRVVESDIWDRIDRKTGIIFGFAGNARRKSFLAAAGGGGRPEVAMVGGGLGWWWLGRKKVIFCSFSGLGQN